VKIIYNNFIATPTIPINGIIQKFFLLNLDMGKNIWLINR
jgi:hypothetical protein